MTRSTVGRSVRLGVASHVGRGVGRSVGLGVLANVGLGVSAMAGMGTRGACVGLAVHVGLGVAKVGLEVGVQVGIAVDGRVEAGTNVEGAAVATGSVVPAGIVVATGGVVATGSVVTTGIVVAVVVGPRVGDGVVLSTVRAGLLGSSVWFSPSPSPCGSFVGVGSIGFVDSNREGGAVISGRKVALGAMDA